MLYGARVIRIETGQPDKIVAEYETESEACEERIRLESLVADPYQVGHAVTLFDLREEALNGRE